MDQEKKQNSQAEVSVASTSCRQCVFCNYEDDEQVGCHANRLQVFSDNDIPILQIEDDEKKYFLIEDKACPYFRHVDIYAGLLEKMSMSELKVEVASSLRMPYQAMIFLRDADSLDMLKERLDELDGQYAKPTIVTIIDRSHSEVDLSPQIVGLFHRIYDFKDWRTQRVQAVDASDLSTVDICYDNTKKLKSFFYTTFEASQAIPALFSKELHDSVIEDMQAFTVLNGIDEHHGRTVLCAAHAKYGGNSFDVDLRAKLVHYNDSIDLIKSVEELCPSFKTC